MQVLAGFFWVLQGFQVLARFSGSCRLSRVLQGLLGLAGCPGSCRFLQGVLGLAGCPGSCRVFWVLQGVQGLAGLWVWQGFFKADEVPGQAPGGGPISSCVGQTAVSDYSHTVRAPQSRAFLQAVSRPCPRTIECRGLQMSTANVDRIVAVSR